MINLFEYQNTEKFDSSFDGLESFLDEIWNNREKTSYYYNDVKGELEAQRFIQFIHNSSEVKSNKYVGVIHYNGKRINLLPKIFYKKDEDINEKKLNQINKHILWWLSYCRKIKFPNYQTNLGSNKSDFFEVLIYLFAKYTRELLNSSIYQQYEEVNNELSFIKGRINTNEYIKRNLSKGRWHKLNCSYDAFVFDNEFNRIIKYVANLLFNVTANQDNKKRLREILFIFDEVADIRATAEQCSSIEFNPMFGEFELVRDYCLLFLSNSISFDYKNDLKLFAFLLPMEYVFEDFVFGFIEKELHEINAKSQRSDKYLDVDKKFNLKPDLWIQTPNTSFIADTKYKIVYSNSVDPKNGISQNDIYQMLAYAIRFRVDEIILFYPNTFAQNQESSTSLSIKDSFAGDKEIKITAYQLPIIDRELMASDINNCVNLGTELESARILLKDSLRKIFKSRIDN